MRLLLLVLLTALWVGPSFSQTAGAPQAPSYVGRWYVEDPAVCKGSGGNTEGLVVYTSKKMAAYENLCDIIRTRATGARTEITMRCRAEGTTSVEKETVELVNGRLRMTFSIDGKTRTYDYRRCP
jgi:hypothetical protein